ncbi:hypothetical protein BXU10_12880 [Flavobacterium sp. LM4]|nr:hypothetical protein BXU10_12880 [Flavobacterium sp. LM4]
MSTNVIFFILFAYRLSLKAGAKVENLLVFTRLSADFSQSFSLLFVNFLITVNLDIEILYFF